MKIFLAAAYVSYGNRQPPKLRQYPDILESFHYLRGGPNMVKAIRGHAPRKIFLDSGAYSAFTKGVTITIPEYAAFINKNRDIIHWAANLDDLKAKDKSEGAEATWRNQKLLEKEVPGVYVLPVYHVREDPKYLKRIIDNYPFMAIGAMVPESIPDLRRMLDELWGRYLTDAKGRARLKVHGFGLTTIDLLRRYPWYSVDSTSWSAYSRMGYVNVILSNGRTLQLTISEKRSARKDLDRHFDSMSPLHQQELTKMFTALGYTVADLRTKSSARAELMVDFYTQLRESGTEVFKQDLGDLFHA